MSAPTLIHGITPNSTKKPCLNTSNHSALSICICQKSEACVTPNPTASTSHWKRQFRGYADYMQTKEFTDALLKILVLARENRVALMCAEALPGKCHRNLIADALVARHVKVRHIISKEGTITHELNELAHVEGTKVTYPLFAKETPQRTLGDFSSA